MSKRTLLSAGIMAAIILILSVELGGAQEANQGRRMRMIVSYNPGGGYDVYSRVIARHLPRYLPGKPSVIVQNMPGGGSAIGANYLYRIAPRDGSVVGIFSPTRVLSQVIGVPGFEFESEKFNWLAAGNISDVLTCFATAAAGVKNLDDAIKRKQPLIVGTTGAGSTTHTWARAYREILGANFKVVAGYPGSTGIRAAMERGELDAGCGVQWSSMRATAKDWLESGTAVIFSQIGVARSQDFPHLENALDRAKTSLDRQVLTALLTENRIGRAYVAPPGVPQDRVRVLRKAFLDALRDSKLVQEAAKAGIDVDPLPGEEVQKVVGELSDFSPEVKERVRNFLEQP